MEVEEAVVLAAAGAVVIVPHPRRGVVRSSQLLLPRPLLPLLAR